MRIKGVKGDIAIPNIVSQIGVCVPAIPIVDLWPCCKHLYGTLPIVAINSYPARGFINT